MSFAPQTPQKMPSTHRNNQPEDERMYSSYMPGPATVIQGGIGLSPGSTMGESARTGSYPATPEQLKRDQAIILSFRDQHIQNIHGVTIRGNEEAARVLSTGSENSDDGDVFIDKGNASGIAGNAVRITAENAQAIFPPTACVFVANLSASCSDDELQRSVHTAFSVFGTVYVKIRRDGKGMPFCFCQFQTAGEAERAVNEGRGLVINGRECRTEIAKAHRAVYLSRIIGGHIPEREARQLLNIYGAIERIWYSNNTDREMFGLPEGIWIQFMFYDTAREARQGLRGSHAYRLYAPDDLRALPGRPGLTVSPARGTTRTQGRPARNNMPINSTNSPAQDEGREVYVSRALAIGLHPQQIAAIFGPVAVNIGFQQNHGFMPYWHQGCQVANPVQSMGSFGYPHQTYAAFNGGYPPMAPFTYAVDPTLPAVGGAVELPGDGL